MVNARSLRQRRWLFWCVGIVLAYTLVGFLVLPLIVRSVAVKQLAKQLGREVTIAKVRINPYVMSATIRGFLIKDKDGQPFVSWNEVHANFQFWSLFTSTYGFREVKVDHPYLRAQVNPDYSLNFSDILDRIAKEAASQPKPEQPSKPLRLRVDRLQISGARLSATDLTTSQPFSKIIGPLELTLLNFATDPDNKNPYSFEGTTEEGERFAWSGHFFLDPVRSAGEFKLENISLAKYAPLYQALVRFDIRDGIVDVRSGYEVGHGATNTARLTNAAVSVRSLKVAEQGATNTAMEVDQFAIEGVSADAFGRIAEVKSVSTRDGRIAMRRNADATINLIELSRPDPGATNTAGSVALLLQSLTNVVELLLRSTNSWVGSIREVNVHNYAVRLEDLAAPRPVRLDLDQIEVKVRNVSNLPGTNITADVNLRWNTNGTLKTSTTLSLFPVQAKVELALDKMEIRALDPYLDSFVNLLVMDGWVGLKGQLDLAAVSNDLPQVTFRGELSIGDFSTVDGVMAEDFVKWQGIQLTGIAARLDPMEVAIKEVAVNGARARLVLAENNTNNLFAVLRMATSTNTLAEEQPKKGATKSASPKISLPTNAVALPTGLPKITIDNVVLTNVQLDFVDRSLKPEVTLAVQQVSGTISGLSSEDLARADVNLRGKVDNTAPMEITGKINPLSTNGFTDLKIKFQGIELIPTSPYAGKFVGYRLAKGKLSLDLHYQLANGRVKGANLVVLDQLTLGEKVESPDATKLPVRLALAVLKDRSGKIELDVPVEGSLQDPEFKLGRVITRALLNVITKIATSPFAALGAVFGGKGEEVSFQEFGAGSGELDTANRAKLDSVVKGLFERPELQLEIEGSVDRTLDRDALRRQKLTKEFKTKKWMSLRRSERSRLTPDQVTLTLEEHADYLREFHAKAYSPEAVAARGGTTNRVLSASATPSAPQGRDTRLEPVVKGATALVRPAKASAPTVPATDLEREALEVIEISESDFTQLAAERARQVKAYILQSGQVAEGRLFLSDRGEGPNTNKGSRVYLHLR